MKKFLLGVVAVLLTAGAHAQEVYVTAGTDGTGIGFGYHLSPAHGVRAEIGGMKFGHNMSAGNWNYKADVSVRHVGAYYDWHPFERNFRLTAGSIFSRDRATLALTGNQFFSYRGYAIALPTDTVSATVRMPDVMPYLGFGWGHGVARGWGMSLDIGAAFGKPSASYAISPLAAAVAPEEIEAMRQEVAKRVAKVKLYPIVKLGLTYTF